MKEVWKEMKQITGCRRNSTIDGYVAVAKHLNYFYSRFNDSATNADGPAIVCCSSHLRLCELEHYQPTSLPCKVSLILHYVLGSFEILLWNYSKPLS